MEEPELEDVFVALLLRQAALPTSDELPPVAMLPSASQGLAIEARSLIRDFGAFRAVVRVSFQVKQGEIFGLLGAIGAGKTTVIKKLNVILPPTS